MKYFKREVDYWWPKVVFVISNLRTILFAGLILWGAIIYGLDRVGVVDADTECPRCIEVLDAGFDAVINFLVPPAHSSTGGEDSTAWIWPRPRFHLTVLP